MNGAKVGSLNRYYNQLELNDVHIPNNARLDILVESMGRINYGAKIIESLKGILTPVLINGNELKGQWKMYTAPLENMPDLSTYSTATVHQGIPAFYVSSFQINNIGDVFINVENWGKGIVFVNGHHLGRFWNVGPQQTLYLPGCWLKKGKNSIIIFDQTNDIIQNKISTSTFPILDKLPNTEKQF